MTTFKVGQPTQAATSPATVCPFPESMGRLRGEDLHGDFAVVLQVMGAIDRRHAAAAELTLEPVAPSEGGLEFFSNGHAEDCAL